MSRSLIRKNQLHPDIADLVSGYGDDFFVTPGELNAALNAFSYIIGEDIVNTTYSELTGLKAANNLTPGKYYRISDFHLMWYNQSINDTGVKSGIAPEPLIVLALSGNKISHEAKSEIYPQDTVYYDIDASGSYSWGTLNNNKAIPDFKGWIYRRIDHKNNIDIGWDWRNITVNCCRPIVTGIPIWTGNVSYSQRNLVRGTGITTTGKLYYSISESNLGNNFTNTNWWLPVSDFIEGNTYFPTDESFSFAVRFNFTIYTGGGGTPIPGFPGFILPNTTTRIQQPTFTSSLTGQGSFSLIGCKNIKINGGYSNVILGDSFISNNIGNNFYYNTIGNGFYYNNIGNDFYSNNIGSYFYSNKIGDGFKSNNVGTVFYINNIGSNFYSNNIGYGFSENIIGNAFNSNVIGDLFYYNTITNNFINNTIKNSFLMNTSEDDLSIGDITSATHVYNQYNTRIFKNSNQTARLSYFNASDQLVVTDPTA